MNKQDVKGKEEFMPEIMHSNWSQLELLRLQEKPVWLF